MNHNPSNDITKRANAELQLTPEDFNREVLVALLDGLERSWYQDFDINKFPIKKMKNGTDLVSELGLIQIYEVPCRPNIRQNRFLLDMQHVIGSLRDGSHSLIYAVSSRQNQVKLLSGVRRFQMNSHYQTDNYIQLLSHSLQSNFPGIVLSPKGGPSSSDFSYRLLPTAEYHSEIIQPIKNWPFLASITGIPSLRTPDNSDGVFSQSIDRLVDALRGKEYLLLVLAEPILDQRLSEIISQLRNLSSEVHALVNQSISISRNRSESQQETDSKSATVSIGAGQVISAIFGIGASIGRTRSITTGITDGTGASLTRESLDKTAQYCEQLIEHHIQRIQNGRSLGFWNTGIYLACGDLNTFMSAQGVISSLYSGSTTYFEPIRIIDLNEPSRKGVRPIIANLENPVLEHLVENTDHPLGPEYQSLGTPLTTNELSLLCSLPEREVPGLKVKQVADFNLNPPLDSEGAEIGSLLYRGEELPARVAIGEKSLLRHSFVTGLTGSGKTNTCLALLEDSYVRRGLNFMVIDPAKTEYRFLLNSKARNEKLKKTLGDALVIFTLGEESISPFRLNPFEFVRDFPLLTHIDLLKAVFNSAFPMYASMPYLLEEALFEIYQERGWDITTSKNRFVDVSDPEMDYTPFLPTMTDLYNKIDDVVASKHYDVRLTLDITAALKARIGSLLRGNKGLMLDTRRSIPIEQLLNQPVVLELQGLGDEDEKAFVIALVFVMLYEATHKRPIDKKLCHVTLIEEAHRLLRNIPVAVSAESANPRGKTVEMFTDMMAEMRARGEGFIVVDQMPSKLVPDVIKGSDIKIVHRLLAHDDRQSVGNAMGLTAEQIDFLSRLTVGQAVVHSEQLEEACLVKIDSVEDLLSSEQEGETAADKSKSISRFMITQADKFRENNVEYFRRFPACGYLSYPRCDAPCTYRQNDENEKTNPSIQAAFDFISTLVYGDGTSAKGAAQKFQKSVESRSPYPLGEKPNFGQFHCILVHLANRSVQKFVQSFAPNDDWEAVLELNSELVVLWELLWENQTLDSQKLVNINQLITKRIALSPRYSRPGCQGCPTPCRFGHRFQNDKKLIVRALAEKIRMNPSTNPIELTLVIDWAAQSLKPGIKDKAHSFAGYCLLTQATSDQSLLASFRSQFFTKKQ